MDKVKAVLQQLQKYHFWLLAVLCMISGVVGWMMASRALSAAYTQEKAKIEKAFSGLKSIYETDNFPNVNWKTELGKLTQDERNKVRQAWEMVYNEQKKVLKWPELLGEKFVEEIEKIPGPPDPANTENIPNDLRILYAQEIPKEVPNVLAIISGPAKEGEPRASDKSDSKPRVEWDSKGALTENMKWGNRAPKSIEVWLAQEDLWVYASLLNVIKQVNGDSYLPKIHRIDTLTIGKSAAEALQAGLTGGVIDGSAQTAAAPAQAAAVAPVGEQAEKAADEGRYVDAEGKPLPGGAATKSEFKRMPVFMKLRIDQREIPKLLVECANSPLPIEVRQLRVNVKSGGQAAKAAPPPAADKGAGGKKEGETHEVPIEMTGIIYIYNKPDIQKLGGPPPTGEPQPAQPAAAGG